MMGALGYCGEALADAGLEARDIDGLSVTRLPDNFRFADTAGLAPDLSSVAPAAGRAAGIAIGTAVMAIATARETRRLGIWQRRQVDWRHVWRSDRSVWRRPAVGTVWHDIAGRVPRNAGCVPRNHVFALHG